VPEPFPVPLPMVGHYLGTDVGLLLKQNPKTVRRGSVLGR
jgi:hypothetical protein